MSLERVLCISLEELFIVFRVAHTLILISKKYCAFV